jgi:tetratricopeptide (TPR) repeat protein
MSAVRYRFGSPASWSKIPLALCFAILPLVLLAGTASSAPSPGPKQRGTHSGKIQPLSDTKLVALANALDSAKQSGDTAAVTAASRELIAYAMRQAAAMQLHRGAVPDSIENYRRASDFSDKPGIHSDLAAAYLSLGRTDDALSELSSTILSDPQNARAWWLQGEAWISKKDYEHAAASLERAVELRPDPLPSYWLGVSLLHLRRPDQAETAFQRTLATAPERSSLHLAISDAYREAGAFDAAAREANRALTLEPHHEAVHYRLGILDVALHEWEVTPDARAEFLKEVQIQPRAFFGNYALGLVNLFEKNFTESDRYLETARRAHPELPEPWLYLGLNAYDRKDNKVAAQDLRRAIALTKDESRGGFQIRRAYYTLARILHQQGETDESAIMLERLREIQSQSVARMQAEGIGTGHGMGASGLTMAFQTLLQGEVGKLPLADPIFASDPLEYVAPSSSGPASADEKQLYQLLAGALNDLGTSEARQEQFSLALAHFHEAERWHSDTPGLMRNIGVAAASTSDYKECIRALGPVLKASPSDTVVRSLLGTALFSTNSYAEAERTLSPLGAQAYRQPGVAYAWAASLVRINHYPQAQGILTQLELQPLPSDLYILVAQAWSQMGNYPRAVATCHKALEVNPQLLRAHFLAGVALIHEDRPGDAADEFRAELRLSPEDTSAQYHLAFVLLQLSRTDEAVRLLRSVLARDPNHAEANYELGTQLLLAGDREGSIPYLENAARLKPQLEAVHYQLQSAYRAVGRKEDADREVKIYREMKAKSRNITLPPPRDSKAVAPPH